MKKIPIVEAALGSIPVTITPPQDFCTEINDFHLTKTYDPRIGIWIEITGVKQAFNHIDMSCLNVFFNQKNKREFVLFNYPRGINSYINPQSHMMKEVGEGIKFLAQKWNLYPVNLITCYSVDNDDPLVKVTNNPKEFGGLKLESLDYVLTAQLNLPDPWEIMSFEALLPLQIDNHSQMRLPVVFSVYSNLNVCLELPPIQSSDLRKKLPTLVEKWASFFRMIPSNNLSYSLQRAEWSYPMGKTSLFSISIHSPMHIRTIQNKLKEDLKEVGGVRSFRSQKSTSR